MILIKLGGSVVTDKSKSMTARHDVIDRLAAEIASVPDKRIIIHGGGSFGHIKAKEYQLHKGFTDESQRDGICQVQNDMRVLNRLIKDGLRKAGIPLASIPAGAIATFDNGKLAKFPSDVFAHYLNIGITPISFGDVVVDKSRGISICSGDDIMVKLATDLKAEKCIFVTAVDGIFPSYPPKDGEGPIPEITPGHEVMFTVKDTDVTGSMQRKLELMFGIARAGCQVQIVNGLVPGRLADVLQGKQTVGTIVKGD
ncbi:MAG: isopentenyl phosphate kinase [Thermoplasmata archaeon]|nr:isopentenyl phosphate kinase [Thermoplasmata archaeon]